MLENLIICNSPHVLVREDAKKKSWSQKLKSWYTVFFQVPVLPELFALMEDISFLDSNMEEAKEKDTEVLEDYKYAFRDFTTWNSVINYYRADFTNNGLEISNRLREKLCSIEVRTLRIFGTGDKYLELEAAKASAKYVKNYQLDTSEHLPYLACKQKWPYTCQG